MLTVVGFESEVHKCIALVCVCLYVCVSVCLCVCVSVCDTASSGVHTECYVTFTHA